jgi:Uma2 family endonuclease
METRIEAMIEDLYHAPDDGGTHELVDGRLVQMPPTGSGPNHVALVIAASLLAYERETGKGRAGTDNLGYIANLPHRKSFSPDASYAFRLPENRMRFVEGAPVFAAEVRSEGDHGTAADRAYAAKRADYFAAGTRVVWDVNPRQRTVASYHAADPDTPRIFQTGEIADAEPALPNWRVAVDELLR